MRESEPGRIDLKEIEYPETLYERDIEDRVFQSIVLHCLASISGIRFVEGNFIDQFLRRSTEGIKGIYAEQDEKNRSVSIRIEVAVLYGVSIPEKSEEIQTRIVEAITNLTGLHVSKVHVIFTNVLADEPCPPKALSPSDEELSLS